MNYLDIIQIALSALLIGAILLQQRGEGGLGSAFGGSSQIYSTRRGIDRWLFISTVILSVLFVATAVIRILV